MCLFLVVVLLGIVVVGSVGNFEVDIKDMVEWFMLFLLLLMKDVGMNNLFFMVDCFGFKLEEVIIDEM